MNVLPSKLPSIQKLMNTFEWKHTTLGEQKNWPSTLHTTISLLMNSSLPMILFWGEKYITFYNEAYIPFIDFKHPALLGRPLLEVWPEQNKNFNKIIKLVYQGESFSYTFQQQHAKNSSSHPLQKITITFNPVHNEHNKISGILGIITNITDHKKPETESIEHLIGGIAHDFNTLLGGIIGNLELMELRIQQKKLEKLPTYINAAQQAASQASVITNQLLSFSRRQTLIPHVTNPNHIIQILTDIFQNILHKNSDKTIFLDFSLSQDIWPVFCDPEQFKTALINIFTNACEAILSLTGRINISSKNLSIDHTLANQLSIKPDDYVKISIKDNGKGIKPEYIDRVTDPFFTTKPLGKRAGLGLSMAYGFTRQSRGYLKLHSRYMEGTIIDLYLPRYRRPLVVENFFTNDTQQLCYKTLIISQDYHLRTLLGEAFEDLGYTATMVKTYPEATTLLNNSSNFDFITIDTRILQQFNNQNIISTLHNNYPDLLILFITGYEKNFVNLSDFTDEKNFIIRQPITYSLLADQIETIKKIREKKFPY
ncbi:hypothetical protein H3T50_05830 [Commensalibacter sp. M0134]|uniref:ATP-binding response regulator n=1 Tax=Commensalibacter TaxID=1079922 RepID=UPI0018DB147F|nr:MULTISPECIES: ATP-binding protein [Commensalibacter]MBI0066191.1 hypothetical protein [Commensalibacter sp. M0134]MBI0070074.1 hypothetical protein [Commensalibacter sp. M0133]MBI0081506.1 hypothetical protein [Commensalibacter melissae]